MKKAQIFYFSLQDEQTKEEKLKWFSGTKLSIVPFQHVQPDQKGNWIDLTVNDFDNLILLIDKDVKRGRSQEAIFYSFTLGIKTDRDLWVYDFSEVDLAEKANYMVRAFESVRQEGTFESLDIKWDRNLNRYIENGVKKKFSSYLIKDAVYRPFVKKKIYYDLHFNKETHQIPSLFSDKTSENLMICFTDAGSQKEFMTIAVRNIPDFHLVGAAASTQCLPLYRYDKNGNRIDNITDWGLQQFQQHYNDPKITKENIFHYTYAVLHNPDYRSKYELNLKREFPRLPFYPNFHQWVNWGKHLMDLHIHYETVQPFGLELVEIKTTKTSTPKPKLKADKTTGTLYLDDITQLEGIPSTAWDYKLGNRSALEWILDQYKEKKPKDPTIAAKFNTYRFADYKDHVIDLLQRVCTVSVETMQIIEQMKNAN